MWEKKSIQQSVSVFQSRRLSQSAERKMIDYLMQWTFVFLAPKNEDQQSSIRPVPVTASQGLNIWLHCFDLFYLHTSYSAVWTGVCYSTPKKLQPRKFLSSCPKSSYCYQSCFYSFHFIVSLFHHFPAWESLIDLAFKDGWQESLGARQSVWEHCINSDTDKLLRLDWMNYLTSGIL